MSRAGERNCIVRDSEGERKKGKRMGTIYTVYSSIISAYFYIFHARIMIKFTFEH